MEQPYGTSQLDVSTEHDREARDDHAPSHSIAIGHGMGEVIKRVAKEIADKNQLRKHYDKQGQADGAGALTLKFDGPPPGFMWYVERIFADIGGGTCKVYKGAIQNNNLKDSAPSANLASLDQASPIFIPQGTELNIVFAGGAANAIGFANLQVREVEA